MRTKVKIGMRVNGEVDSGTIIAMTSEWCIYKLDKPWKDGTQECAENWTSIQLAIDPPESGQEVSSINEQEL
jgi:hypothetical protein